MKINFFRYQNKFALQIFIPANTLAMKLYLSYISIFIKPISFKFTLIMYDKIVKYIFCSCYYNI